MIIWKFPLSLMDRITIEMPKGSQVLHVGQQNNVLMLWAMCDPDAEMEGRDFVVTATGEPIDSNYDMKYIGTVHFGGFVWHVFDTSVMYQG